MEAKEIGDLGENLAENFLKAKKYEILAKNWRSSHQEIDLIAQKNNTTIFIEVKTRKNHFFGFPEFAVDEKKQKHLAKAAQKFLEKNPQKGEIRFDIIAITLDSNPVEIKHFEDAFFPSN